MAPSRKYNSVGAGETPKLGVGTPFGIARPGTKNSIHNVQVSTMAVTHSTDIPKVARPGGRVAPKVKGSPQPPKAARPGVRQGVQKRPTTH
jgi:hypothetical protein